MFFATPMLYYAAYLLVYGIVNFVIAEKTIREKNYWTTYTYFYGTKWIKDVLDSFGTSLAPILFMFFHALYVFGGILIATVGFWSYHFNIISNIVFLLWSFYNGANFYMESFSRKYEKNLAALQEYETRIKK